MPPFRRALRDIKRILRGDIIREVTWSRRAKDQLEHDRARWSGRCKRTGPWRGVVIALPFNLLVRVRLGSKFSSTALVLTPYLSFYRSTYFRSLSVHWLLGHCTIQYLGGKKGLRLSSMARARRKRLGARAESTFWTYR